MSCSENESNDQIDTIDDIKFISEIIYTNSNNDVFQTVSFNYDQCNRIIDDTINNSLFTLEFIVNYSLNNISEIIISQDFIAPQSTDIYETNNISITNNMIIIANNERSRKLQTTNN